MIVLKIQLLSCLGKPPGKPEINKLLTSKKVDSRLGNPANVMCSATNPLPVHYKWTKDGEELHNLDKIMVHNNINSGRDSEAPERF